MKPGKHSSLRRSWRQSRRDDRNRAAALGRFFIPAFLLRALHAGLFAPAIVFFHEIRDLTFWTRPRQWSIPKGKVALWITTAGEEDLPLFRSLLGQVPATVWPWTFHARTHGLGKLAVRIPGTGHKSSKSPVLNHHGAPAALAEIRRGGLLLDDRNIPGLIFHKFFGVPTPRVAGAG